MSYYKGKMEALRKERGGRCILELDGCWLTRGLEFAHITPTPVNGRGRGLPQRYHDIKNNPEAYLLVCRACHAKADDLAEQFHNYDLEEVPF